MLFQKKPIIVKAEQATELTAIETLEGRMLAEPGDWIITGLKGERYPCKPDIFEMTYEPVPETAISTSTNWRTIEDRCF